MDKKQLALDIIERLKKNIRMPDVRWNIAKRGSFLSACALQPSALMRG